MNPTIDQIQQACGFLFLNERSVFVYYCKKCESEFDSGINLEAHITLQHQEDKKMHFENIFVGDGIFDDVKFKADIKVEVLSSDDEAEEKVAKDEEVKGEKSKGEVCESGGSEDEEKEDEYWSKYDGVVSNELQKGERTAIEGGDNWTVNGIQSISEYSGRSSSRSSSDGSIKCNENRSAKRRYSIKNRINGIKPPTIFYCDICPVKKSFSNKDNLKQHMKRHIANKVRKTCPVCQKVPLNYDKHMQINHLESSPYKCDFCGAAFRNNNNRVVHMRGHTGERPFLCQACGKTFKSQDTRNKHNMRMHTKQLPYRCLPCNRQFISPSQLLDHKLAFHSDIRPYSCEVCGMDFATKKNLRKHRLSHGERKHPCKYCDKKFKTSDTRRWHERMVHKAV